MIKFMEINYSNKYKIIINLVPAIAVKLGL